MTDTPGNDGFAHVSMETIEEFLAHAHALEMEAAEKYEELADCMAVHNNIEVADVFRRLSKEGQKHASQMLARAGDRELPQIAPWDFKWGDGGAPECPPEENTHYLMTPYHALQIARVAEQKARDFYAAVAKGSAETEISSMASEFAAEEQEHIDLLDGWIEKVPEPEEGWDFDPDPPVMP